MKRRKREETEKGRQKIGRREREKDRKQVVEILYIERQTEILLRKKGDRKQAVEILKRERETENRQ